MSKIPPHLNPLPPGERKERKKNSPTLGRGKKTLPPGERKEKGNGRKRE